eukprot:87949_1
MSEGAQRKLQSSVEEMMERVDKRHLRPVQKAAYTCMANCFDNTQAPQAQISHCQEKCAARSERLQKVVQSEINSLQERVQRCAVACQDEAKDSIPAGTNPGDAKFERAQKGMDRCVTTCADKMVKLMPQMEARIVAASKE